MKKIALLLFGFFSFSFGFVSAEQAKGTPADSGEGKNKEKVADVMVDRKEGEIHLTRELTESIRLGQDYLARMQKEDGSMRLSKGDSTAIVSLAVMSWMVNGNLPGEGPYGKNVSLGVSYLLEHCKPSGMVYKGNKHGKEAMYHHGLATICLAEAWGHSTEKDIQDKLKKAVELIVRCQGTKGKNRGGWRYEPRPNSGADLSVTVMQLLALRAARDAGIAVPEETINRAIQYIEKNRGKEDKDGVGGFGYSGPSSKAQSTTAMGITSLMLCGDYEPERLKGPIKNLVNFQKAGDTKKMKYFIYGHYYAALAMYQIGSTEEKEFKKHWLDWYPWIAADLLKMQKKFVNRGRLRGAFSMNDTYGVTDSFSLLILGIPYRYLPIYQR